MNEELKESIREANDIVEVIGEYVDLRGSGNIRTGFCPFHEDRKTPNLKVFINTQSWHCFTCKAGNDVFAFIERIKKCDFVEAMRILAQRAGIPLPAWSQEQEQYIKDKRRIEDVLQATADFYATQLTDEIKRYLIQERCLDIEKIAEEYGIEIGWAGLHNGPLLLSYLNGKGYTESEAIRTGVLFEHEKAYFENRIIIPNVFHRRVVYLIGRAYPCHSKENRKYLKLQGTKVSADYLYNEQAIWRDRDIVITEGPFDALALLQHYDAKDFPYGVCAVESTTLSKKHLKKFDKVGLVYVSMDGDEAGLRANREIGQIFEEKARLVKIPNGEDVNEFLKHNDITAYKKLLKKARTPIEVEICVVCEEASKLPSDEHKDRKVQERLEPILERIAELNNSVKENYYLEYIKNNLNISKKPLMDFIKQRRKQAQKKKASEVDMVIEELDEEAIRVCPSLDYINDTLYVTVTVDAEVTKKTNEGRSYTEICQIPYIITSKKEKLSIDDLRARRFVIMSEPYCSRTGSRWPQKYVKQYLAGRDEKINPALAFKILKAIWDYYLEFKDPRMSSLIPLFEIGEYFYPIFSSYPHLLFTGIKESGKTKCGIIIAFVGFNTSGSAGVTMANLVRTAHLTRGTIIIDEAFESMSKERRFEIEGFLKINRKEDPPIRKVHKDSHKLEEFNGYCPKVLCNIRGVREVLLSRCILIPMLRYKTKEIGDTWPTALERRADGTIVSGKDWAGIRDILYRFALYYATDVKRIYLEDPEVLNVEISGRERDKWRPLLSIAKFLDQNGCEGLFETIKGLAIEKGKKARLVDLDTWTEALVQTLLSLCPKYQNEVPYQKIEEALTETLGKPPSKTWIGLNLAQYEFMADKVRRTIDDKPNQIVYVVNFKEVERFAKRYKLID